MPKTRRAQPLGGQTLPRSGTRTKKDAKSLAREEDKENIGKQVTQSRQHRRTGVLGATTTGVSNVASTKPRIPKGAAKRKSSQVKEKKLPLQDITSQFLPAPESANRGAGSEGGGELALPIPELSYPMMAVPIASYPSNVLTSPLPPSSPPADLVLSPFKPTHYGSELLDGIIDHIDDQSHNPFLGDITEKVQHTSSSSDPFGFAALERKLKGERKFIADALATRANEDDDDIYEELQAIPVADTSSPRPVRRIKQSLTSLEGERPSSEDEAIESVHDLLAHPHFSTPPTPRKDKHIQRRPSREGQDIFSPCSTSIESSPSPTKMSANKRRRDFLFGQEGSNAAADKSEGAAITTDKPPSKRQCQKEDDERPNMITWNLRPRRPAPAKKAETNRKPLKSVPGSKSSKKAKSSSSKKATNAFDDGDLKEKWKQEREERIKYFDRLTDYSVEKENVYII